MIDISAGAKLLLSENRTTLFKADMLIQPISAVGKNLNGIYNGIVISQSPAYEDIYIYGNSVIDFSAIPISLISTYRYMILSINIKVNSISSETAYFNEMGLFYKIKNSAFSSTARSAIDVHFTVGEYIRCTCAIDMQSEAFLNIKNVIDYMYGITLTSSESDITMNLSYKEAMIEFNNTGVFSGYTAPYLNSGGAYTDFTEMSELPLVGADVMSGTIAFGDSTSSSTSFDIGAATINELTLTLNNYDGKFSSIDFTGAKIIPYVGIPLETTEWVKKGYFTVDKPTSIGNTIPLKMLDNMSLFEKPFSGVTLTFPTTCVEALQAICLYCGVVLSSTTFTNYDFVLSTRPDDDTLTCLSMVSYIAQICGCFARMDNNGYLELKWYEIGAFEDVCSIDGGSFEYPTGDIEIDGGTFNYATPEEIIDGGSFDYGDFHVCKTITSFSVGTDEITITGIKVTVDENNSFAVGYDGYVLEISDNPLVTADNMETVAQFLGNKIAGMTFRPFSISALNDIAVEAGDAMRVYDINGNYYDGYITSCGYKFGNYENFACNAETFSEKNATSYSAITKAAQIAKKETQKALSSYDLAVINMNEIAMNALGYYSSYTEDLDGSRISYIHNKLTRAESTIIYMLSASGFFLSTDGGATYTAGFDSEGNAVLNVLSAIGINCDWINAGTLTLGGTDNVNGLLSVLNASGTQVVRADKDGIYAVAGTIGSFSLGANRLGAIGVGLCMDNDSKMFEAWTAARNTRMTPGSLKICAGGSGNGVDIFNNSTTYTGQHTTMRDNGFAIYDVNGTQKMSLTGQQLYFNNDLSTINADGHGFFLAELFGLVYYWREHGGW